MDTGWYLEHPWQPTHMGWHGGRDLGTMVFDQIPKEKGSPLADINSSGLRESISVDMHLLMFLCNKLLWRRGALSGPKWGLGPEPKPLCGSIWFGPRAQTSVWKHLVLKQQQPWPGHGLATDSIKCIISQQNNLDAPLWPP